MLPTLFCVGRRAFLGGLVGLWDAQKADLASRDRGVCYVRHADHDEWWADTRYWADDGIHPNDAGYRVWGEHIGRSILRHVELRRAASNDRFATRN